MEEIILDTELNVGVNIQLRRTTKKIQHRSWPYKTSTKHTYYLYWAVPGNDRGWNPIGDFTTLKKAMTHLGKMVKAAEKLNFNILTHE